MRLKLLQKEQFKKQQEQPVIWVVIKFQKFQKLHTNIIQKQLQMRTIKKCQKKDIYLQTKDKKLCMIWGNYDSKIMEYKKNWLVIRSMTEKKLTTKYFRNSYKENDKEIPKERCISPEETQKIIDNVRLALIWVGF